MEDEDTSCGLMADDVEGDDDAHAHGTNATVAAAPAVAAADGAYADGTSRPPAYRDDRGDRSDDAGGGDERSGDSEDDGDNDDCWSSNPLLDAASKPLRVLFAYTIPDPETHPDWYPLTFLISLFYVAVQSELCCFLAEDICAILRVPHEYAGVTLLALGAQVPDTITSISMARGGMYDGAITSAIGSQVLNITLGIGVPFALFSWLNNAPIVATLGNIRSVSICLFVSIALYLVSCIKCCAGGNTNGAHVSACGAFIMLAGFIGCNWYMASTMLQGWSL